MHFGWVMICCSVAVCCYVQASMQAGRLAGKSHLDLLCSPQQRPIITSNHPPPRPFWLTHDPLYYLPSNR